jgi:hypothetical protein
MYLINPAAVRATPVTTKVGIGAAKELVVKQEATAVVFIPS